VYVTSGIVYDKALIPEQNSCPGTKQILSRDKTDLSRDKADLSRDKADLSQDKSLAHGSPSENMPIRVNANEELLTLLGSDFG